MASYNRVVLMGNLTRDPELRTLPSGMAVTDIGLAVNDRRKDANGNIIEEATFVDITLWGRNAEIAVEYTKKGTSILIEGRLKLDTWETDGQKRSKLKVVGERLCLLGGRSGGSGEGYSSPPSKAGNQGGQGQHSQGQHSQGQHSGSGQYGGQQYGSQQYGGQQHGGPYNSPGQYTQGPYDGPPDMSSTPDDIPF